MEGESLSWRTDKQFNLPPAGLTIASPYDVEVRYSNKRGLTWHGYKAHLTETCDDQTPHLIIHVETTPVDILDNQAVSGRKAVLMWRNSISIGTSRWPLVPRE